MVIEVRSHRPTPAPAATTTTTQAGNEKTQHSNHTNTDAPVPKLSSPQMKGVKLSPPSSLESIRLPKNFHPVGVSNSRRFRRFAT